MHWWKLVDEFALFPCNIEANEATNSWETVGKPNKFNKM